MDTNDRKKEQPVVTNSTTIGTAGIVHSGSGNVYSNAPLYIGNTLATKDDFLAALATLKNGLDEAHKQGLPEDTYVDAVAEVQAAELEAKRDAPRSSRIVKRLEDTKSLLTAGTGIATVTIAGIEASNKLISLIEPLLQHVSKLFS